MHSKIISLSGYTCEEELFEWTNGRGVDYVIEMDDLTYARDILDAIGTVDSDNQVHVDFNKLGSYLKEAYEFFESKIKNFTYENFCDSFKVHELQWALDDELSVMVYSEYAGLQTWFSFLRMLHKGKDNPELQTWTINQLFDYHY